MTSWKKYLALGLTAAFMFADVNLELSAPGGVSFRIGSPAEARVGHPLTPLSYAGVARRTTRRVVTRTAVRVSVLPPSCVYGPYYGGYYYRCGGIYYARQGGVYVQVIIN